MFKPKRLVMMMALSTLIALSALVAVPATSHASACGIQYWGVHTVKGYPIPSGQLAHCIRGHGYHIDGDGADFGSIGNICDPSIRFTYGFGKYYHNGSVHWGCHHTGVWGYRPNWNAPRGSACAELWAKNWRVLVARQCHYVSG